MAASSRESPNPHSDLVCNSMALSMLVAILAIRWLLFARIDARVREDLVAEVEISTTKIAANFGTRREALPPLQGEQKAIAHPSS